jgi:hypothetical protein
MLRDYRQVGDRLWERFKAGREDIHWYHGSCIRALRTTWEHPILEELEDTVERLYAVSAA